MIVFLEPQKVHIAAATTTPTVAPDFQKIKRKKKGKASSKKTDAKNQQKSGSRYLALVQSSDYTSNFRNSLLQYILKMLIFRW